MTRFPPWFRGFPGQCAATPHCQSSVGQPQVPSGVGSSECMQPGSAGAAFSVRRWTIAPLWRGSSAIERQSLVTDLLETSERTRHKTAVSPSHSSGSSGTLSHPSNCSPNLPISPSELHRLQPLFDLYPNHRLNTAIHPHLSEDLRQTTFYPFYRPIVAKDGQ